MRNQRIQKVDQLWFRKKLVALAVQYAYGYKWWSEYPLYYLATEKIYYHNSKRPRMLRSPPHLTSFKLQNNLSHFTFGAFWKLTWRWNRAFWRNCRYKGTAWCPFSPAKAQEIYHNYLWQRLFAQQAAKPNNFQKKRQTKDVGNFTFVCLSSWFLSKLISLCLFVSPLMK